MFTRSHLQELKRRYASMYASPVDKEVIEDGTIEGANQYRKDTPGQGEEVEEHCGVCGQGIKEVGVEESFELQATMALDDVGIKSKWKKGKLYVAKRDIKKAEKALGKSFKKMKKGAEPDLYYEEVELDEYAFHYQHDDYWGEKKKVKKDQKEFLVKLDLANASWGDDEDYGDIRKYYWDKKDPTILHVAKNKRIVKKVQAFVKKYRYSLDTSKVKVVGDVREEVELDEKGTAYPATVDTLRKIVKDKQHQTVMFKSGKALVDLFTASAMVQVYDALKKPDMKKTFEKMITDKAGFMKTQAFAMKMIGK